MYELKSAFLEPLLCVCSMSCLILELILNILIKNKKISLGVSYDSCYTPLIIINQNRLFPSKGSYHLTVLSASYPVFVPSNTESMNYKNCWFHQLVQRRRALYNYTFCGLIQTLPLARILSAIFPINFFT